MHHKTAVMIEVKKATCVGFRLSPLKSFREDKKADERLDGQ